MKKFCAGELYTDAKGTVVVYIISIFRFGCKSLCTRQLLPKRTSVLCMKPDDFRRKYPKKITGVVLIDE